MTSQIPSRNNSNFRAAVQTRSQRGVRAASHSEDSIGRLGLRNQRDSRQYPKPGEGFSPSPAEGERVGVRRKACSATVSSQAPSPWPSPPPRGRGNPLRAPVAQSVAFSVSGPSVATSGLKLWQRACRILLVLAAAVFSLSSPLVAQPLAIPSGDEFFHDGAQCYLTNNLARAREQVDEGLKLFPNDTKLKKLDELLKQQQQQQSKDDQKKDEQEKKEEEKKQEQKKQDQKDQQQQDKKDSKDKKDQQKPEEQKKSSGEKKDKKDEKDKGEPSQPMQAHAMTPQEAKQLLDAQKGDEQVLQFKPQEKPEQLGKTLKDW